MGCSFKWQRLPEQNARNSDHSFAQVAAVLPPHRDGDQQQGQQLPEQIALMPGH